MTRIVVLLWVCLLSSSATAETAEEMLSNCRLIANAQVKDGGVAMPQDHSSGICWGAFASIQTVIWYADVDQGKKVVHPLLKVCAPKRGTRTQLIAVFMAYAEKHPQKYNEDFFGVAIAALRDAFPCIGALRWNPSLGQDLGRP